MLRYPLFHSTPFDVDQSATRQPRSKPYVGEGDVRRQQPMDLEIVDFEAVWRHQSQITNTHTPDENDYHQRVRIGGPGEHTTTQ